MRNAERNLTNLTESCLTHLDGEERMLTETLALVEETRRSLQERNITRLLNAVARLEQNQQRRVTVQEDRMRLRKAISQEFGIAPEEATLGTLLTRLSAPFRDSLESRRVRLQEMAKKIDKLNRANVALVGSFGEILQRVLFDLTGHGVARCYGPSGRMDSWDGNSILETDY